MNRKEGRKEGRKNKYIVAIILALLILPMTYTKCQAQDVGILLYPIIQSAVEYYGKKLIDKAFEKKTPEIEKYSVGKYEVHFSENMVQNKPCYLFQAYEKDVGVKYVYFEKDLPEDVEKIEAFKKMTEIEKKQFLQKTFAKYDFDLGYVEEPVKTVEAPATKETASATPTDSPAEPAAAPTN